MPEGSGSGDNSTRNTPILTFEDYERPGANQLSVIDILSEPPGVEDVDLEIPITREEAHPVGFD